MEKIRPGDNVEFYNQAFSGDNYEEPILHKKVMNLIRKRKIEYKKVLDIGAGNGKLLEMLEQSSDKHAVDISETGVKIMKGKGINAICHNISLEKLPYPDNRFDLVICTEVLEHIVNPEVVMSEAFRVLKPGGIFISSVPNIYQLATFILVFLDIPPINSARYGSQHYRDYTKKILKRAWKEHGFIVKKMIGDIIFPFKGAVSRFFAGIFPRLSHRIISVCQKPAIGE
ncbi:MAG: hypothetical protein A2Y33_16465 [Spirochaetes bacterium GWF1_51_8]|nr:MAG: hypothetical protein A2Y33_16465 [Spirochaetes bacterium GWF1_51_8]